ncbi:MAG: elongation factor 3 [Alphaproteobacteria bacterium 64-6]|nr:MAG: elongation factor 3 [Alphaproteobacteria bacterium 64-6]
MAIELIRLFGIHLTFGTTALLSGADLSVRAGDRIGLVGRNGSGKSTLLKIAAGLVVPDQGERFVHPGARVAYLPQEADLSGFESVAAYVEAGLAEGEGAYLAQSALEILGLSGSEDPAQISGGEARRAAIARALAASPDVLLLDEPTNHLDLPAIEWLEKELGSQRAAIVLISHDRRFLETLTRTTVWIDRGIARRLDKGFAAFEGWRDEVIEQEELDRHKLDRKIAREESWMHGGVTARRKRNVRRVAELRKLRAERKDARGPVGNVRFAVSEGGTSGKLVIEAENISKSFDDRPIVRDLSLRIARGDRLGIIGPNGAGKTTLLAMLTGALAPDSGTIKLGTNLEMVTLDQRREQLKPDWTLADALTGGRGDQVIVNGAARHVIGYMKDFLFAPEQARTPLSVLSGGERGRLMLARALARPSNMLVLDEPTNDLDLETLDLLQELLADYAGTVLLVSHDRDFLDRVATSVLAAEGEGRWIEYAGGYSDMLAQRGGSQEPQAKQRAAPRTADTTEPPSQEAAASPAPQRKLSYKQTQALEALPKQIAALESEIAALGRRLADPNLFARDPAAFNESTTRLARAEAELAEAEHAWLELELLRDEIAHHRATTKR